MMVHWHKTRTSAALLLDRGWTVIELTVYVPQLEDIAWIKM